MTYRNHQPGRPKIKLMLLCLFLFGPAYFLEGTSSQAISRYELPNGLSLIVEKNELSDHTSLCLLIRGGRVAVPSGKEGLSYLTARLSLDPPDTDFLHRLMKTGSEIKIASRGDFLVVAVEALSSEFESTMKLVERTLLRPIFSGIRVSNLKRVLEENQKKETDDIDSQAEAALLAAFFGPHGYGASAYGQPASLQAIKSQDVSAFHSKYFAGQNSIVAVVSNLEAEIIRRVVNSTLGKLPRGERQQLEAPSPRLPEEPNVFIEKDTKIVYLALAFPLPSLTPENFILNHLLANILGSTPGSFLWPLRSTEKIAYEVGSRLILQKGGGCFWVYLKTFPGKINEAKEKLKMTITGLRKNGLSSDELEMACQSYRLSILMTKENKAKQSEALAIYAGWDWPVDFDEQLLSKLERIGPEELNSYILSVLDPEKAVFLQIGPRN